MWAHITSTIFAKFQDKGVLYPGRYRDVAADVVAAVPELRTDQGFAATVETLTSKLRGKFANKRRMVDDLTGDRPVRKGPKLQTYEGLTNFLPRKPTNLILVEKHVQEMTSGAGDPEALMDATFDDRRDLIVRKKASVSVVRERYPLLLRSEDSMWREMARMGLRKNKDEAIGAVRDVLQRVQRVVGCAVDKAAVSLTWLLGEGTEVFFTVDPVSHRHAQAAIYDSTTIVVDGEMLLKAVDPTEALILWGLAHYLLSLKYTKGKKTAMLVGWAIGVEPVARLNKQVQAILAKLGVEL